MCYFQLEEACFQAAAEERALSRASRTQTLYNADLLLSLQYCSWVFTYSVCYFQLEEARLQAAAEEQALSEHLIRELEAEERERARREQEELDRQKLSDEHLAKELSEALQQVRLTQPFYDACQFEL